MPPVASNNDAAPRADGEWPRHRAYQSRREYLSICEDIDTGRAGEPPETDTRALA
jgi:hypothetical protein